MKKRHLISVLAVAAFVALLFFLKRESAAYQDKENKRHLDQIDGDDVPYDFAVPDTGAVTKIIISDKSPDKVVLERSGRHWLVNGKYIARQDAIEVLLETFYRVRLQNYPPNAAVENILKFMGTYGKHVQVFQGEHLARSFTVGTETNNMLGTYMLKDGFDMPVATYLPGFNGYLSSRFFTREDLWRTREIFPLSKPIQSVTLAYPDTALMTIKFVENSYLIVGNNSKPLEANPLACQALFDAIKQVQYEGMIIPTEGAFQKKDSITSKAPVASIAVQYSDGEKAQMRLYRVPGGPDVLDAEGNPQEWDPDRFYALLSDGRFVLTQRYGLQHVLKSFRAFTSKN